MQAPLRYIGFSGGGWNTHTASSGIMSAALQMARERGAANGDFGLLLDNFNGAAGNSGGSWFLTMLSYSPGFADALANQADDWFTSGYMGQQRQIFQPTALEVSGYIKTNLIETINASLEATPIYQSIKKIPIIGTWTEREIRETIASISSNLISFVIDEIYANTPLLTNNWDKYGLFGMWFKRGLLENKLNWLEIVRNTVYEPYGMSNLLSNSFANANRNPWADKLKLIFPGALNTSNVFSFSNLKSINPSYYTTSAEAINPAFPSGQFISPASIIIGPSNKNTNTLKLLGSGFSQEFRRNSILSSILDQSDSRLLEQEFNSDLSIIESTSLSSAVAGDFASITTLDAFIKSHVNDAIGNWLKTDPVSEISSLQSWIGSVAKKELTKRLSALAENISEFFTPALAATFTSSLAVPLNLSDKSAQYQSPQSFDNISELSASQNYRFIDGGYVDNTTTASLISELQAAAGIQSQFELTLFINASGDSRGKIPANETGEDVDGASIGDLENVPVDLMKLFGWGETLLPDNDIDHNNEQLRPAPMSRTKAAFPYIFDRSAWRGEKPVWQWNNEDKWKNDKEKATYLAFYKLNVETIDNPYYSIKGNQKGELNIFTSYNESSGPGPSKPDSFTIYENIYQATREGIINQGGYVHLLSAMNVMNLETNEKGQLSFASDEGLNHLVQIDLDQVDTDYLSLIDIYKLTADGQRIYSGSLGGSDEEAPFEYDNGPQALMMNAGDSLEFEMQTKSSPDPIKGSIQLQEVDNGYQLLGFKNGDSLFSATASFAPVIDGKESVSDDDTARDSSDDTYFSFTEGTRLKIAVNAIADMTNRFTIIKIDRDPITGEASYLGSAIDSSEMNDLLINTFGQEQSGTQFGSKTLNPYSQREFTWTVEETGLFAPVLLTEEGGIFALGHDLIGESTHTRILGDYTVGFEDQYDRNSDYDYNDAIIKFEAIA